MRIFSVVVLVVFSVGAIVAEWQSLVKGFADVGGSVLMFNLLSLGLGYGTARSMSLDRRIVIAIAFQLGIRSAVLSIYVAMTSLNDMRFALPAAVYSITMVLLGLSFGIWVRGRKEGLSEKPSALVDANEIVHTVR